MIDLENKALLPAGLRDILPPEAARNRYSRNVGRYLCQSRLRPRETSACRVRRRLTSGAGEAVSADTFRLMDPVSQRMMVCGPT